MKKNKSKKAVKDIYEECASANECTGALQKIDLDVDEVEKFHRQFTGD